MIFFIVEEQSYKASKAGQVSQPVQACKPGLGTCPSRPHQHFFGGVKLMFVGVVNFGQIQKISFVNVKIFWSNFNQFLVIMIWSSELAFM